MNDLHFGVAVGIDHYPGLDDLEHAVRDAEEFAGWLGDPAGGGLPAGNVATVLSPSSIPDGWARHSARPTVDEVLHHLAAFRKQADEKTREDPAAWDRTRLYVFVSGHGIAPRPDDAALLLANADLDNVGYNLPCGELRDWFLEAQSFHEVLVFADCCRERIPGTPAGFLPWTRRQGDNGQVRWLLGCATYFGDFAYEMRDEAPPDERRGYFTRALLDALRGECPDDGAGNITTHALADFVQQRVSDATSGRMRVQRPTMPSAENFVVCRVARPQTPAFAVTLRFPAAYAGTVELRRGGRPVGRHAVGDREWTVPLTAGVYEVIGVDPPDGYAPFANEGMFRAKREGQHVEL